MPVTRTISPAQDARSMKEPIQKGRLTIVQRGDFTGSLRTVHVSRAALLLCVHATGAFGAAVSPTYPEDDPLGPGL